MHYLNLGRATRVLVAPRFVGSPARANAASYVLEGWVKTNLALASPTLDLRDVNGVVVFALHAAQDAQAYLESGHGRLVENRVGGADQASKAGQIFQRQAGATSLALRTPRGFVAEMPRPFLDTSPTRFAQFQGRAVKAKPAGTPDFAELKPWIDGELAPRKSCIARWMPLPHDAAFRKAMTDGVAGHREWERLLFPERFVKPTSAPLTCPGGVR